MSSDLPDRLHLSGFVRLTDHGFALPAYQVKPSANAWYYAVPDVSGDHGSFIKGFELLEDEAVEQFDSGILVGPGEAWRDVFLWQGHIYAGRPAEIFAELEEFRSDILKLAPLSFLDLALPAEAPDTEEIAEFARDLLKQKLGSDRGEASYVSLLLQPKILIELRKAVLSNPPTDMSIAPHNFSIESRGQKSYGIRLAPTLSETFDEAAAGRLRTAVRRFAQQLGITLVVGGLRGEIAGGGVEPKRLIEQRAIKRTRRPIRRDLPNILIIATDARSQAICRHLELPSSIEFGSGSVHEIDYRIEHRSDLTDLPTSRDGVILIVADVAAMDVGRTLSVFDAFVWLAGNDALSDERSSRIHELVRRRDRQTPFLIAPAPPADGPSFLLEGRSTAGEVLKQADAVIDTTLARSPFWTGQARRSIDRRMADMVATVSVLAAATGKVRQDLTKRRGSKQPHAVSVCIGDRPLGHETASELNATGLRGIERDRRSGSQHAFEITDNEGGLVRNATVEISPLWTDFENFGEAAFLEAVGRQEAWLGRSLITEVPDSLRLSLDAPALSVALKNRDGRPSMVLTAEAPRLATIREGYESDLAVIRYTDTATIRMAALSKKISGLPSEMRLGKLSRLAQNQGLVTRGLDARDVLRLQERDWLEIQTHGTSRLQSQARIYRPTAEELDDGREIAIPVAAVWEGIRSNDVTALELLERFPDLRQRGERGGKRPSDLEAAWTMPSDGVQRWVIEDGRIPVRAALLRPGEAPAQRLFFIDGDEAVPCFVFSRLFAVWARSLLPPSTSWASRFQVSRTFDAFPFPLCFRITRPSEGLPQLRFAKGPRRLEELGHRLRYEFMDNGRRTASRGSEDQGLGQQIELLEELDEILLGEMKMSLRTSDLEILEALVERNQARH
ncbi:hypothetical protein J5289_29060 (plasmid) [Rhizobium sp. B230/85]|uniref:hypothetical protein n=1 Tax=unclassified Rhizobium TaxID=2613769 RepID=UPI001ADC73BC|nr:MULTISPECIES: hypothetical protein [unclassified Rhizobium]MBO9136209.1 hypothetical protein [Rhizobium sp. B209b/85]QXZ99899.1 hypothetical protein J5289_29060 [Rhizobium sp. B230/85]